MKGWYEAFQGGLHPSTVVIGRGTFISDGNRFPAVLTRSRAYRQEWVWAPTGRNGATEQYPRDGRFRNGWYRLGQRLVQLDGFPSA